MTGSFQIPYGFGTGSYPQSPGSGSLFLDTSNNLVYVANTGSWGIVGTQTTPPAAIASADIEYLLVAGGGAGGNTYSYGVDGGGGGGAGGLLSSSLASVESGSSFTVTIGAGGSQATNAQGGAGVDSSIAGATISTITTTGGGGGGGYSTNAGGNGGSGGGSTNAGAAGSGTVGQGNDGYGGSGNANGGGGATQAGGVDQSPNGGQGGSGSLSYITGTATGYAGGGSGGSDSSTSTYTAGGYGGGGRGAAPGAALIGENGITNTGGGGGGGSANDSYSNGGAGGSGVVILAYPTASISATGGVRTFFNDRVAHTFNSSGTLSVGGVKTYTHNSVDPLGDSSGLVLYKLDGNANDAGGNYNGSATSVTYNQAVINDGAVFNGSAHIESSGLKGALPYGSAARSFSFWVNLSSFSGDVYFFSYGEGTNGQFFAGRVQSSPQNIGFMGYAADFTTSTAMTANEWMHLVYTYDGTTLKIYKNGSEIGSSTLSLNTVNSRRFCMGARDYNGSVTKYINGSIDQFRAFNKALSASEVTTLYIE